VEQRECYLGWQILLPGAAKRAWHLFERFGSPADAWRSTEKQLVTIGGFTPDGARELVLRRRSIHPEAEMAFLEKKGVSFLSYIDPGYPDLLKKIFDPPPGLFVKGEFNDSGIQSVAVVGSRRATRYGLAVAEKLAGDLAGSGVTVVSGLARGIDTAAHQGALAAGGRTVAVLGCGVDVGYPAQNRKLKDQIALTGAVISEFPLQTTPQPWHFPIRNRIVSGLSSGVVIVECAEKSGALITADFALEQGREVMAVPGNITSALSRGPNLLVRQGARPVENAGDVLEELGLDRLFRVDKPETPAVSLSPEEKAVSDVLSTDPVTLDQIVERSGLPAQKALATLTFLEMKGFAHQLTGRLYVSSGNIR